MCSNLSNWGTEARFRSGTEGARLPQMMMPSSTIPAATQARWTMGVTLAVSAMGLAVSCVTYNIRSGGRREMEHRIIHAGIALDVVETDAGGVAQVVLELHHRHVLTLEAEPHAVEIRILH